MNISLIIDAVFIAITLFCIIKYAIKGLVKAVMDVFKVIISIAVTYVLRIPVSKFIDTVFMNKSLVSWAKNSLIFTKTGEGEGTNMVEFYENTPSVFVKFLEKFGLDTQMVEGGLNNISQASDEQIDIMANNIGSSISSLLSMVISLVAVFFIAIILLTILIHVFNLLTKFPFINGLNKILGAVYGGAVAFIIMWALSTIIFILINLLGSSYPEILGPSIVENSIILKFFHERDILQIVKTTFTKT